MRQFSTPTIAPAWPRILLAFGLIFAAALQASWSTLDRYFISDDFAYVGRFYHLSLREWPALFVNDWSGGIWGSTLPELRPFAALTFLVDAHFWGANPLGYHLTNFALDAACACLVGLIVWRLHAAPLWLSCAAGILFAWHPAHAEPVAWITGRVDLLGTLAYLVGFYSAGRFLQNSGRPLWLAVAWLAYFIGCFSKEFCLTLPIALMLWALIFPALLGPTRLRQFVVLLSGFLLVAAIFLLCRRLAFGPSGVGVAALNLLGGEYAERQVDYLRWYFPPLYDLGRDFRPQLVAWASPLVGGLLCAVLVALGVWRRRNPESNRWRAITFYGLAWYAIATLPLAVATYFAPRHLYLATAGLCIGVGLLLSTIAARRWWAYGIVVVAALFCVSRFNHAVAPWRHAAKLSERVSVEIARTLPDMRPREILLLDVPEVYAGVWMWSWSTPFALQPPFMPPIANAVLTRPANYYAPQFWAQQPALGALSGASGAVLISADDRGVVTPRRIEQSRLQPAATRLQLAAATNPDLAWKTFLRALHSP